VTVTAAGANGIITVTYSNTGAQSANAKINGATLLMTSTDNLGSVSWACSKGVTLQDKWIPAACR